MRFGILGPVQVTVDDQPVPVRGEQLRGLLAMLLLRANRVVPVEQLIDVVWGTPASPAARHRLQVRIAELRATLTRPDEAERLVFRRPGYVLRVDPDELDLERFARLAEQGSELLAGGDAGRASRTLADALALWRGAVLEDVGLPGLRDQLIRLEGRRLAALEDAVTHHPTRERLASLLILALYRDARPGDALSVYASLRHRLVTDLGIEPSRTVQRLHRQILTADPALDPPPPASSTARRDAPVPAQLPADIAGFAGRSAELAALNSMVDSRVGPGATVVISAIGGTAGVGKTALAVHWGHRMRHRFPDGQLYVNLRGFDPSGPQGAHPAPRRQASSRRGHRAERHRLAPRPTR